MGKTVSLCVKRVVEVDDKFANREVGEDQPDKAGTHFPESKVYRGVCSNHICDMSVGDDVLISGPTGAEMLLPEDPEANIIMLNWDRHRAHAVLLASALQRQSWRR